MSNDDRKNEREDGGGRVDHAWVIERVEGYVTGGLSEEERAAVDGHVNNCPECFDALTEAREADRTFQRVLGPLAPSADFENQLVTVLQEKHMPRRKNLLVRRAAVGIAACLAFAATGVLANYVVSRDVLNNPVSKKLAMDEGKLDPISKMTWAREGESSRSYAAKNLRGLLQSGNMYANSDDVFPTTQAAEVALVRTSSASPESRSTRFGTVVLNGGTHVSAGTLVVGQDQVKASREKMQEAQQLLAQGKNEEALKQVEKAIHANPQNAAAQVTKNILEEKLRAEREEKLSDWDRQQNALALREAKQLDEQRARTRSVDKKRRVDELMKDAQKFIEVQQHKEAADTLRLALEIDKENSPAKLMLMLVTDKIYYRSYDRLSQMQTSEKAREMIDNKEHLIPYADLLVYPEDWVDLTRTRAGERDGREMRELTRNRTAVERVEPPTFSLSDTTKGGTTTGVPGSLSGTMGGTPANSATRYSFGVAGAGILPATLLPVENADQYEGKKSGGDGNGKLATNYWRAGDAVSGGKDGGKSGSGGWTSNNGGKDGQNVGLSDAHAEWTRKPDVEKHSDNIWTKDASGNATPYDIVMVPGTGQPKHFMAKNGELEKATSELGTAGLKSIQNEQGLTDDGRTFIGKTGSASGKSPAGGQDVPTQVDRDLVAKNAELNRGNNDLATQKSLADKKLHEGLAASKTAQGTDDFGIGWNLNIPAGSVPGNPQSPSPDTLKVAANTSPMANTNTGQAPQTVQAPVAPEIAERKIIRNGEVEFEVRSFEDAYATVAAVVGEEKGYVSSTSSDKLANGKVRGVIVVRVPPERLDRLLLKLRGIGDLKAQQIAANDVTKQYTDLESELRALRAMEERLINLIKSGKGEVKDIIEAEKQLGTYRVRTEKIEGEMRYYNNLVSLATLTVTAFEKDIQKPTAASELESVTMSVEAEDVETRYRDARKIIDDAKGRIVESELKKLDADQFAARVVADVPPDKADFVAAQLKQLGKTAAYNRDRKQTTSGGTGAPAVAVEQKDTRFTISLYNLANIAPRETTVLTVAVPDVEATYKLLQAAVRKDAPKEAGKEDAKSDGKVATIGRVVSSNMAGERPEQRTADLRLDVRAADADAILQTIRNAGEVLASTLNENPDTANVTTAKRGIQLRLVAIAAVPPRETTVMNIAVRDVEGVYKKLQEKVRQPGKGGVEAGSAGAAGRIVASNLNGQRPEQMTADVRAEIRPQETEAVLQLLRESGEVLNSSISESTDTANTTASKRGVVVRLINVAAIPARESQAWRTVAADVSTSYGKLADALGVLQADGGVRVLTSQLNESNPNAITATLQLEVRRDSWAAMNKAFVDAGIELTSRNITRNTDTVGTLDSKVRISVDELVSAESLAPRRTSVIGRQVADVEKSLDSVRAALMGTAAREVDFNLTKEQNGRISGHIVIDVPVGQAMSVLTKVRDLGGEEQINSVVKNTQVPDTKFARERIELTLTSKPTLISNEQSMGTTMRAAVSSAASALSWSLYLIITGVLFTGPWLLLVYVAWKLLRRKKKTATVA